MDLATLVGPIGAIVALAAAVITGGSASKFLNTASLLIVIVGTLLVVLMKFNLGQFLGAIGVAKRASFKKLVIHRN